MVLKGLDINVLTNFCSQQLDHATCFECCKYYVAPATATCGHTLCHGCWHGRRKCATCASPVQRKSLQLNLPLQILTEHVQLLVEAFEKLFNIKLDEFALEIPNAVTQEDPEKNVKDWLANSQNRFSAHISSQSSQDPPVEYLTSKVQIHSTNVNIKYPPKVLHIPLPQDNWDKIETMPDEDECVTKDQLNILEPLLEDPLENDNNEYSIGKLRRSIRNKESTSNSLKESNDIQNEKIDTKSSTIMPLKSSKKVKQTWNNVKKMKKEFSKLNKENRNKLNVSIEMCKKTQISNHIAKQYDKEKLTPDIIEDITPNALLTNREDEQHDINKETVLPNSIENQSSPKSVFVDLNEKSIQEKDKIGYNELTTHKQPSIIINQNKNSNTMDIENKDITEKSKVKFIKKGALQMNTKENVQTYTSDNKDFTSSADDIQIIIKIGTTITNICIKKKDSDIQVKVNTDQEVQTSLGTQNVSKNVKTCNSNMDNNSQSISTNFGESRPICKTTQENTQSLNKTTQHSKIENKSILTKKSTASADTKTAQFEITESVEKEISDIMECVENETLEVNSRKNQYLKSSTESQQLQNSSQKKNVPEDIDYINDVDIFDCEMSNTPNVELLKSTKKGPSKILVPTQNKNIKRKLMENASELLNNSNDSPQNKKQKVSSNEENKLDQSNFKVAVNDSECNNYDQVMGKVFANIDKDMEIVHKDANLSKIDNVSNAPQSQSEFKKNTHQIDNQKYSENIFSIMDTDESNLTKKANTQVAKPALHTIESLTQNLSQEFTSVPEEEKETGDVELIELGTPFQENYDSDKSVVEETPQKDVSIPKIKQKSTTSFPTDVNLNKIPNTINNDNKQSVDNQSVINLTADSVSDLTKSSKENTFIEINNVRPTLETPQTINRFFDEVKCKPKSTPMARKSLNFNRQRVYDNDPEQTLCPSSIAVAKTTQEKEFMNEVFEESCESPTYKKTTLSISRMQRQNKLCIAGSCLTNIDLAKLKLLCKEKGWSYVEKYTKDLTHLVVGVDEENKSQRSVKYMCSLAAGKWIISYAWVEKCFQSGTVLSEEPFETLDVTGEPGPRRSRLAKKKLFEGISFYCMQPFSVLNVDILKIPSGQCQLFNHQTVLRHPWTLATLRDLQMPCRPLTHSRPIAHCVIKRHCSHFQAKKTDCTPCVRRSCTAIISTDMLEAAGGRVMNDASEVRVQNGKPALLLAEPEQTQVDKFIYLAMELSIVPVNYEWVLNCLGNYTLGSIHELLLCPSTLLPPETHKWPHELIARESE